MGLARGASATSTSSVPANTALATASAHYEHHAGGAAAPPNSAAVPGPPPATGHAAAPIDYCTCAGASVNPQAAGWHTESFIRGCGLLAATASVPVVLRCA